ncbi:MAG: EpsI family protein [Planctomycetes bacterium]|nr:EpsI family protein [Planctomycetota bacterium]
MAVVLLITAGGAYRAMASRLYGDALTPVKLPVPLEQVPERIGDWVGQDLPIPANIVDYMKQNFADDYISRRYLNDKEGIWADLYIVYCSSHPGGILGHQPLVCFPGNGWIHDETASSQFVSSSGRPIRCLVHRFHKPEPAYQQIVVLNFYVLNGQITLSERQFSSPLGRLPNLSGDPARYVAQVQVSSTLEHSALTAAAEMADIFLAFLPSPKDHAPVTPGGN